MTKQPMVPQQVAVLHCSLFRLFLFGRGTVGMTQTLPIGKPNQVSDLISTMKLSFVDRTKLTTKLVPRQTCLSSEPETDARRVWLRQGPAGCIRLGARGEWLCCRQIEKPPSFHGLGRHGYLI